MEQVEPTEEQKKEKKNRQTAVIMGIVFLTAGIHQQKPMSVTATYIIIGLLVISIVFGCQKKYRYFLIFSFFVFIKLLMKYFDNLLTFM